MRDRRPADPSKPPSRAPGIAARIALVAAAVLSLLLIWAAHGYLTEIYSEDLRNRANVRAAIYRGTLINALERHRLVPSVLARDRTLIDALIKQRYALTSARLIEVNRELGARNLILMDRQGRVVAASDRLQLGRSDLDKVYFREAARENGTIFRVTGIKERDLGFFFAHAVRSGGQLLGVIAVQVNLAPTEEAWAQDSGRIFVTNSEDVVILASTADWRYTLLSPRLEEARMAALRSRQLGGLDILSMDWTGTGRQVRVDGSTYLRRETAVRFRGWTLNYLAPMDEVRAEVNAVIAFAVMALALLAALIFWINSKRVWRRLLRLKRESDELRDLNRRLSDEILERRRVEQTLARTEQSLEQASKLAALGQMSAAVSHELNQPLAAMRTYIAGARLLIERDRTQEAHASIQRMDDLIGRMGQLTRQLKSFARKGEQEIRPVDLRDAIRGALSVMQPQLDLYAVATDIDMPSSPVMVRGDQLRIEQVLVNLLRNALDAIKDQTERRIDVDLVPGPVCAIRVSDNGPGLPKDADSIFEPFFTTKKPGEGLGLGLAISAGIAQDLDGKLSARDVEGGACFELTLPALAQVETAAE